MKSATKKPKTQLKDDTGNDDARYLAVAARRPSALSHISIRGARTHNLKNIDLDIPRNQLVVITGLSGSGKSSLAFDTLYAEGQRRYVESLSTYARQFLQLMDKPDVDVIEGLSPAISIEQKATSHNPRSTVGTVTEIHDYLRLLFARAGTPFCPDHNLPLQALSVSQMVDAILAFPEDTKLMLLAPVAREKKGEFLETFAELQAKGYVRFRLNGEVVMHEDLPKLKKTEKHDIDVVVDRVKVKPEIKQRLAESLEAALRLGEGRVIALDMDTGTEHLFNAKFACPHCNYSIAELEPRLFSFNSPVGACETCDGLGQMEYFDESRVVAFPSISLANGAIKGWDARNSFYHSALKSLAKHYKFDLDKPFESLPDETQKIVLYGSGAEEIKFQYVFESGGLAGQTYTKKQPFEGIIPNMQRRYRETDSNVVREDLAKYRSQQPCSTCGGARLKREARHVFLVDSATLEKSALHDLSHLTLRDAQAYFQNLKLTGSRAEIATKVVQEIAARLKFLNDVGLNYLSLSRSAETLSGGESQRIRLASQIGSGLTGVMYVLDEPSIGLHQRDNDRLIGTLRNLRDIGNSVLVVEHDEDMIRAADHVIDMGVGAGVHGGRVIAEGTCEQILATQESLTGQYMSGVREIAVPLRRAQDKSKLLTIHKATGHNLKGVTVNIPIGLFTCVTGVSGSGKSTLVNDTLYKAAAHAIHRAQDEHAPCEAVDGLEQFDKVINVDQSPIGRTPRSNPATYTGLFTPIRELMAEMSVAKERGYTSGRFSFNVSAASGGGRCEACQGDGVKRVEMHFLPDVYVPCDVCHGKRYNRETLEVQFKGKNIAEILDMTVDTAFHFFQAQPTLARKLQTLLDVGLSYIKLGQSATTLSGGEAQRVKLSLELSKRDTGRTLYILDEPTTGLHFADIDLLLKVLHQLRDQGNTLVIIEHNLDVIKTADWVIDMGPEGGAGGGTVMGVGTPEDIAEIRESFTGKYLKRVLEQVKRRSGL